MSDEHILRKPRLFKRPIPAARERSSSIIIGVPNPGSPARRLRKGPYRAGLRWPGFMDYGGDINWQVFARSNHFQESGSNAALTAGAATCRTASPGALRGRVNRDKRLRYFAEAFLSQFTRLPPALTLPRAVFAVRSRRASIYQKLHVLQEDGNRGVRSDVGLSSFRFVCYCFF